MISLKKQTQTFLFFLEESLSPTLFFFFRDLFTVKKKSLVVVVDACFTGEKKKDFTDERGTNYSDARFKKKNGPVNVSTTQCFFF